MYKKSSPNWVKHLDFLLIDLLCLHLAFWSAIIVSKCFGLDFSDKIFIHLSVFITLVDILVHVFSETLKHVLRRGFYKEFAITLKHVCLVELVVVFYAYATLDNNNYSKITLFLMGGFYLVLSYVTRVLWKKIARKGFFKTNKRSLLIITTEKNVSSIVKSIEKYNFNSFRIAGIAVIDKDLVGKKIRGVKVVANIGNVTSYVCRQWVDEVFIDLPQDYKNFDNLFDKFIEMGVVVHTNIGSQHRKSGINQIVEKFGQYNVLTTSINFATPGQLFLKRTMDIIGGLFGCIATLFLCLILGPIIYIKSPGPIFFKQERIGKNGKKFKMYKFRSMYMDAEQRKQELMEENIMSDGMMFKAEWDPRIIGSKILPDGTKKKGIGNFIRDWSLDEFPQFINVLKGEMSLVGTRPPTVDEWEKYELHHRARLATKPGVTGMWQVSGRSNITDFEEVVKLDTDYINRWTIGLDIKILFKTIAVVFKKEGSM